MSKTEKLSHIGILLIGISALVVSIWQVQLAQHHNKLSVRPYLRFKVTNGMADSEFSHHLAITNSGQGPAILNSFEYEVDGKTTSDFSEALLYAGLKGNIGRHMVQTFDPGDVLEEKTTEHLFGIDDISGKTKTIHVKVKYTSMYDEAFELEFDY